MILVHSDEDEESGDEDEDEDEDASSQAKAPIKNIKMPKYPNTATQDDIADIALKQLRANQIWTHRLVVKQAGGGRCDAILAAARCSDVAGGAEWSEGAT